MKQTFFLLLVFSLTVVACDEPIPHIVFNTIDSIPPVDTITGDNYDGKTPVVDELVIDYTTPDPYQHVPQLFLDSTLSSSWDDAGFPNAKDFQAFYQTFQWDVMDRNKEKISALILYPLPGYKDNKAFLRNFDSIFSDKLFPDISMPFISMWETTKSEFLQSLFSILFSSLSYFSSYQIPESCFSP